MTYWQLYGWTENSPIVMNTGRSKSALFVRHTTLEPNWIPINSLGWIMYTYLCPSIHGIKLPVQNVDCYWRLTAETKDRMSWILAILSWSEPDFIPSRWSFRFYLSRAKEFYCGTYFYQNKKSLWRLNHWWYVAKWSGDFETVKFHLNKLWFI